MVTMSKYDSLQDAEEHLKELLKDTCSYEDKRVCLNLEYSTVYVERISDEKIEVEVSMPKFVKLDLTMEEFKKFASEIQHVQSELSFMATGTKFADCAFSIRTKRVYKGTPEFGCTITSDRGS